MGSVEEIKKDFMCKRSQMKGRIKAESYKSRWFLLTPSKFSYCDGRIEVCTFGWIAYFTIWCTTQIFLDVPKTAFLKLRPTTCHVGIFEFVFTISLSEWITSDNYYYHWEVRRRNSTAAKEVANFPRLFPDSSLLASGGIRTPKTRSNIPMDRQLPDSDDSDQTIFSCRKWMCP